jgi:hypothetical protein
MSFENIFPKFIDFCTKSRIELVEYNDTVIEEMLAYYTQFDNGAITLKDLKREIFKLDTNKKYKG